MIKTIYAVSRGDFSDYGVNHLYTKREDAEAFCKRENDKGKDDSWFDTYYVEEFDLHTRLKKEPKTYNHLCLRGYIGHDGAVLIEHKSTSKYLEKRENLDFKYSEYHGVNWVLVRKIKETNIDNIDIKKYIKIISDAYRQYKATDLIKEMIANA